MTCRLRGLACCRVFHGWADVLQVYTGDSWDLPCDCGVRRCEETRSCCSLADPFSSELRELLGQEAALKACSAPEPTPAENLPMDTLSYSSDLLWAYHMQQARSPTPFLGYAAPALVSAGDVLDECDQWLRAVAGRSAPEECARTVGDFLLAVGNLARAREWAA